MQHRTLLAIDPHPRAMRPLSSMSGVYPIKRNRIVSDRPYVMYMGGATVSMVMRHCNYTRYKVVELFTRWDAMNNEPKPTFDPEE